MLYFYLLEKLNLPLRKGIKYRVKFSIFTMSEHLKIGTHAEKVVKMISDSKKLLPLVSVCLQ